MKISTMRVAILATAATLCSGSTLFAQNAGDSMAADKTFVMLADEGNTAEITASQIALKKSKNPEVLAYAKQMIDDHNKLRSDMKPIADKLQVTTPQPLNANHKAQDARLSQLHGEKFDKEYIKNMDQDHHKTVGLFQNEIATTSNDEVKSGAQAGLPVVQMHTDMADQMAGKMGVPTATTPGQ